MTRRGLVIAAWGALALAAAAIPGQSWSGTLDDRPWPAMREARGGSCHGQPPACERSKWVAFLTDLKLTELTAPSGGRAYRWLWVNVTREPNFGVSVPSIGFVEVVVAPDGSGRLRSSWSDQAAQIEAADIAPFEAALAKTDFATLPDEDPTGANWLDDPPEQLMEAVVDGRYHFVHRVGGISERGIRDAGVLLETLARRVLPPPPARDDRR